MNDASLIDSSGLQEASTLARRYWNTFERDPGAGRAIAGGNAVVIVEAQALAITLPKVPVSYTHLTLPTIYSV